MFALVNAPRQGPFDWDAPGVASGYADRVLALMAQRGLDLRDRVRLELEPEHIGVWPDRRSSSRADSGPATSAATSPADDT